MGGDVNIQQPPVVAVDSEPEPLPPRYREDETIRIAGLARKVAEIRLGHEAVCDLTFKNCRILGPATLFVQEPKSPMTFIGCKWTEGERAFSVASPRQHAGDAEVVRLHHCVFWGCRFENVEMAVTQETYERYKRGEVNL